jgi:deoxyribodipyrimidine photo-lyase
VPDKYIHVPWTMPAAEQQRVGCAIGRDTPAPIIDHTVQRVLALALFRQAALPGRPMR